MKITYYLLSFLILFPAYLTSQKRNIEILALSGISITTSSENFKEYYSGYNFGVGIGYSFKPQLTAIASFNYNSFSLDKSELSSELGLKETDLNNVDSEINAFNILANLKFNLSEFSDFISPFIQLGIGYYHFSNEIELLNATDSQSRESLIWSWGWN